MVGADSHRIPLAPRYSGYLIIASGFRLQVFHLLWMNFPEHSTINPQPLLRSYNPRMTSILVWALPISLAATPGISFDFFSFGYWDVSIPQVCSLSGVRTLLRTGYPIQKSPDQSLLPAPRGLSQVATSFFASMCQGIHHVPFLSYRIFLVRYTRLLTSSSWLDDTFTLINICLDFPRKPSIQFWILNYELWIKKHLFCF